MADEILCAECGRPVGDRLALCTFCGDRLVAELLAVPGVLADLGTMRAGLARFSDGRVGGRSTETPLPVQSVARLQKEGKPEDPRGAELRGDRAYTRLETALVGWARILADYLGVEIPIGERGLMQLAINGRAAPRDPGQSPALGVVRWTVKDKDGNLHDHARLVRRDADALAQPAGQLEQAAVWMACHPHELRAHEAAHEMLTEITGALEQVRRIVDRPVELNYLGPCSTELPGGVDCGFVLRAERGETYVRCGRCKTQFAVADLQARARTIAEDRLYTLGEMGNILSAVGSPVPPRTLRWWTTHRKNDRLEPRGWQHVDAYGVRITDHQIADPDKPVYRLGDALKLAERGENEGGSAA